MPFAIPVHSLYGERQNAIAIPAQFLYGPAAQLIPDDGRALLADGAALDHQNSGEAS
ncbi:hypothetical protein [Palleronia aestuarii]|uniref:hypothetical protein n=1 Tax=Palleronia aestuarii TaxID=568105 RepID=UPI00147650A7|nr:hypothetical protein [Palleronia aestuarii]